MVSTWENVWENVWCVTSRHVWCAEHRGITAIHKHYTVEQWKTWAEGVGVFNDPIFNGPRTCYPGSTLLHGDSIYPHD